ncbi:aspartate-semialdehyde dehydrogenase [Actinoplanes sp. NPDC026623]|uniref:aspartate-semialdehyde dehydrogenase n=1 Tax=Actinoplanes sp. NPDC026623 TaxID=3155610 RepID=UPI0033DF2285
MRLGIVGATGNVGTVMLALLAERAFPIRRLRLFASARSAGRTLSWGGREVAVEDASTADWTDLDIVIFSAGADTSRELCEKVAAAGAVVIDNSSAWRRDPDVPLVVAEVNPEALARRPRGIIANPNCTTMAIMPVLKPLHDWARLTALVATTYQSVSGAGLGAIGELKAQTALALEHVDDLVHRGSSVDLGPSATFARPIAFNVLPLAGAMVEDGLGETEEEQKLRHESRKILGIADLKVSGTCVRVPVFTGHSIQVHARFERPIVTADVHRLLAGAPGVTLTEIPTSLQAAGRDATYVGRIRTDETAENAIALFCSSDNLRKGAALNAIQLAELVASTAERSLPNVTACQIRKQGSGRRLCVEPALDGALTGPVDKGRRDGLGAAMMPR